MDELVSTFTEWINGAEYARMYPQINERNVFSISTLAYSVEKQVDWKVDGKRPEVHSRISTMMFNGKAKHEYIFSRMQSLNEGWHFERELSIHLPFTWQKYPKLSGITLLGHADAIRYSPEFEIFELKTTDFNGPPIIGAYAILQAGTYAYILGLENRGVAPKTTIIKINHEVVTKVLSFEEIDSAWTEMEKRAYDCAVKVDV